MKNCKGKNVIKPDVGWSISDYSFCKKNHRINPKKFLVNKVNRKIRQFFNKLIKKELLK